VTVWRPFLIVVAIALLVASVALAVSSRSTQPTPDPAPNATLVPPVSVPTLQVGPAGGPPNPNTVPVPAAGTCHITPTGLPDPICTPGALSATLTVAQLCAAGFTTRNERPPVAYTNALKRRLMASYGLTDSPANYELDHLVPLEDLGHPWSPLNLWPEPRRVLHVEPNAEEKDVVENHIHKSICADPTHATDYAARLAADWTQFRTQALVASATEPTPEPEP
jgi:hypothetical protein